MWWQEERHGGAHREAMDIDCMGASFRLPCRYLDRREQVVQLRWAAGGGNLSALPMPPIVEEEDVGSMRILECGDRAEMHAGQMKAMTDDDGWRGVWLCPKLAAEDSAVC